MPVPQHFILRLIELFDIENSRVYILAYVSARFDRQRLRDLGDLLLAVV